MVLCDILEWFNKNYFILCNSLKSSKTSLKIKWPQILDWIHPPIFAKYFCYMSSLQSISQNKYDMATEIDDMASEKIWHG